MNTEEKLESVMAQLNWFIEKDKNMLPADLKGTLNDLSGILSEVRLKQEHDIKKGQIQGICFAVAESLRNSDQSKYAIKNWSVTRQDAIDADVPEFDMEALTDVWES